MKRILLFLICLISFATATLAQSACDFYCDFEECQPGGSGESCVPVRNYKRYFRFLPRVNDPENFASGPAFIVGNGGTSSISPVKNGSNAMYITVDGTNYGYFVGKTSVTGQRCAAYMAFKAETGVTYTLDFDWRLRSGLGVAIERGNFAIAYEQPTLANIQNGATTLFLNSNGVVNSGKGVALNKPGTSTNIWNNMTSDWQHATVTWTSDRTATVYLVIGYINEQPSYGVSSTYVPLAIDNFRFTAGTGCTDCIIECTDNFVSYSVYTCADTWRCPINGVEYNDVDYDLTWPLYINESLLDSGNHCLNCMPTSVCSMFYTIDLHLNSGVQVEMSEVVCNGEPYYFFGELKTTSGTYTHTISKTETGAECDTIVRLNLTVENKNAGTATINFGTQPCDSYVTYRGKYYNTDGPHIFRVPNAMPSGCDSVYTINVTFEKGVTDTTEVTLCAGMTYTWSVNGQTYSYQAGTRYFSEDDGCDTHVLKLKGGSILNHEDPSVTLCPGQTYTWSRNGVTYSYDSEEKIYNYTDGCDRYYLTITPSDLTLAGSETHEMCENETYTWRGKTYTSNDFGYHNDTVFATCEYYRLYLYEKNPTTVNQTATLCHGKNITWRGKTITAPGVYKDTVTAECKIYQVTVTEIFGDTHVEEQHFCYGETIDFDYHGTRITAPGFYAVTDVNPVNGCDDIYNLTVTQDSSPRMKMETKSACYGQHVTLNGHTTTKEGMNTWHITTADGCDSTYSIYLTWYPHTVDHVYETICQGETYHWDCNNTDYTVADTYRCVTNNRYGCPDTTYLHLTVKSVATHAPETVSVCKLSLPYKWPVNNQNYNAGGTYYATKNNANGCPEDYTLVLQVTNPTTVNESNTYCPRHPITWRGKTITAGGTYRDTVKSECKIYVLTVSAGSDKLAAVENVTVCKDAAYTWRGKSINTSTIGVKNINDTVVKSSGCDSIYRLKLTVQNIPAVVNETIRVCKGVKASYRGNQYNARTSGYETIIAPSSTLGCDTTIHLYVREWPQNPGTASFNVCPGEKYTFDGTQYGAGTHLVTLKTTKGAHGCDSLVNLTINEYDTVAHVETVEICSNKSYKWSVNNQTYSTAGTYHATKNNANGCPEDYYLNLTVKPVATATYNFKVCKGKQYTYRGVNYPAGTTGVVRTIAGVAPNGCDSVVTINVTEWPQVTGSATGKCCHGGTYKYPANNTDYAAGTHNITLAGAGAHGCDSLVTLVVTEYPQNAGTETGWACPGKKYTYPANGLQYAISATPYNITLSGAGAHGCDSIVNLTVKAYATTSHTESQTICEGKSYTWSANNTTYTTGGTYTCKKNNANGCEETWTLNLTVTPAPTKTHTLHTCPGGTVTFHGTAYNVGTHNNIVVKDASGCDSILTLNVVAWPEPTGEVTAYVCKGAKYKYHNVDYAEGTYNNIRVSGAAAHGCDSIVTLKVIAYPEARRTVSTSICQGQTYFLGGRTFNTSCSNYEFRHSGVAAHGCDSIYTLTLTVKPNSTATITEYTCPGTPLSYNGNTYPKGGPYTVHLTSANNCDSVVTLYVEEKAVATHAPEVVNWCDNKGPYSWHGVNYTTTGVYPIQEENAVTHCTEEFTLDLRVWQAKTNTKTLWACPGHTVTYEGSEYGVGGPYTVRLETAHGCDSVITLTVNQYTVQTHAQEDVTICDDALPYTWTPVTGHPFTYNTGGLKTEQIENANGCLETYTLNLTVNPTKTTNLSETVCPGEKYTYRSVDYAPKATPYQITLQTSKGCDSTIYLTVSEYTVQTHETENVTICDDALPYTWTPVTGHPFTYSTGGLKTEQIANANSCLETYTLNLTVNPTKTTNIPVSVCPGKKYTYRSVQYAPRTEPYEIVLQTSKGCDSTIYLTVSEYTVQTHETEDVTICDDALPYTWTPVTGHPFTYSTGGLKTEQIENADGCLETYKLNLTVNPTRTNNFTDYVCPGKTLSYHGNNYPAGGPYTVHLTTSKGCDSVVTFNVVERTLATHDPETVTICSNELPYTWRGKTCDAAGQYTKSEENGDGCTEEYTLQLYVNQVKTTTLTETVCAGKSYTVGTQTFSASGNYSVTLTSKDGCDSVVNLNLTVAPKPTVEESYSICPGGTITVHGQTLSLANVYYIDDYDVDGCLHTYEVTILHHIANDHDESYALCDGETYTWHEQSISGPGTYTAQQDNGFGCKENYTLNVTKIYPKTATINETIHEGQSVTVGGQTFDSAVTGHVITLKGQASNGCDSVITLNVTYLANSQSVVTEEICQGGSVTIGGQVFDHAVTNQTITLSGGAANGSDSIIIATVTVKPKKYETVNESICQGGSIVIGGQTFDSAVTGATVTTTASNGCDSIITVNITVKEKKYANITEHICDGGSVTIAGQTFSSAVTDQTITLTNGASNGCDSIITATVIVDPRPSYTTNEAICQGQSYTWPVNNQSYTVGGTYSHTKTIAGGCKEDYILNLTVNPNNTFNETKAICSGSTYSWHDQTLSISGNYTANETDANGCTETYNLALTVNDAIVINETHDICDGETYAWHGQNITTGGTYTATETNAEGCTENYSVVVTLKPRTNHTETYAICDGETYNWHGQSITTGGTYTASQANASGCMEDYTLTVTVKPRVNHTESYSMCDGETYTWQGQTITTGGTYTAQKANADGCIENYTLNVTIKPRTNHNETYSMCDGDVYVWHGQTITATGTYTATETNAAGCEETYKVVVNVNPKNEHNEEYTICNGESYSWMGNSYSVAGIYAATAVNAYGCLEPYLLTLKVNPRQDYTETQTICQGETLAWHGQVLSAAGVYNATETTVDGCIENYTITLTLLPREDHTETASICDGETYNWHGQALTETGVYTAQETNANGCTENYTLTLTVYPVVAHNESYTMCKGETYSWMGNLYSASGTYTATAPNANGCNEPYTLTLTVNDREDHNETYSICNGETYNWHGQALTTAGTYTATAVNANGCTENYTLVLTIKPREDHNETASICQGETYAWHGMNLTTANTYTVTEVNDNGCNETYTLVLTVKPVVEHNDTHAMCQGESYTWMGNVYTAAGTYYAVAPNANGCNENYTLTLTVKDRTDHSETAEICNGETYTWHGNSYTAAGTYTAQQTNANGCVENYTLTLTVKAADSHHDTHEICDGETYHWHGLNLTTAGNYTATETNAYGCTENYTLALTVKERRDFNESYEMCNGETYTWHGQTLTATGVYTASVDDNANGCVDNYTLALVVKPREDHNETYEMCNGETYLWHGQTLTTTGIYTAQETNDYGCIENYTLALAVKPRQDYNETHAICNGDSYTWHGQTLSVEGTYTAQETNADGCVENYTLALTVKPRVDIYETDEICNGETYTWHGQALTTSGVYTASVDDNTNGCFDIYTLTLTVKPREDHYETQEICHGEVYSWHGDLYNTTGIYTIQETNAYGCVENYTLALTVKAAQNHTEDYALCNGESYTWHGQVLTTAGVYHATETNINGCAEKYTLNLTIKPREDHHETHAVCKNQGYTWHGQNLTESGVYYATETNADGCVENYTLILTVRPCEDKTETVEICQGETYTWNGQEYNATGVYTVTVTNDECTENHTLVLTVNPSVNHNETHEMCDGETYIWHGQSIIAAGTYTASQTNAFGCTEIYTLDVTVKNRVDSIETAEICNGDKYPWHGQLLDSTGVYTVSEVNAQGCVDTYTLTLVVKPAANFSETHEICKGETYIWHGQTLTSTGIYSATETNEYGCEEEYTLALTVNPRAEHNETASICQGDVYTWHGQTYTTTGVYTAQQANADGCMENYTLTLTVKDRQDHTESHSICKGETYMWHGQALTTAGVYHATAINANGCEENYTLTLAVKPREDHNQTAEICKGETYTWNGTDYSATGIYTVNIDNADGCSEKHTLVLVVKSRSNHDETYTMCDGESYTWHGQNITSAGTYTATETNDEGCEETYTLTVTVKPREDHNENHEICDGESYTWHGQLLTTTGIYTATEINANGCVENYTLALTVRNRQDYTENYAICNGDSYTWHGQTLTTAGVYTAQETNAYGCKENYTLTLTVNAREDHTETAEICADETYAWHNQALTTAGTYTAQETTTDGCVENYTLTLTVKPRQDHNEQYELCDGESYTWHGQTLTTTGVYTATETVNGCVENYTLALTVKERADYEETYTICKGETYEWHGQNLTATGIYHATETRANGCVENFTLALTVKNRADHSETYTMCDGETYNWHGQAISATGTYTAVENNAEGCPESYTIDVTVKPRQDYNETAEICNGETYTWHGQALTTSGVYTASETNANGCIENYTLTLTVKPREDHNEITEICAGDTIQWHGQNITATGIYTAQETNDYGCVENYTIGVTVKARQDHNETVEICAGETLTWHGQTLTTTGNYTAYEVNANGCNEVYNLALTVKDRQDYNETYEICNGEIYTWHGQALATAGVYTATETNAGGCVENYTLTLTVQPRGDHSETVEICQGDTYNWHGQEYTTTGVYTTTETNAYSCDENFTLILIVNNRQDHTETAELCDGETYNWHGQAITAAGTYTAQEANADGCVENYTLTLTVNARQDYNETYEICKGETYTWHGQALTASGVYVATETTDKGCKEKYTLTLTVKPRADHNETAEICNGETYTWHGQALTTTGIYTATETNDYGCDENFTLALTVKPRQDYNETAEICNGETYTWHGQALTVAGTYTAVEQNADGCNENYTLVLTVKDREDHVEAAEICDGELYPWHGQVLSASGIYTAQETNANGCVENYSLTLTVKARQDHTETHQICKGDTYNWHGQALTETGIYTAQETNAAGCVENYTLTLVVKNREAHTETYEMCDGDTYNWHGMSIVIAGVYTATEINADGCDELYTLTVTVNPREDHYEVYTICEGETYTWHGQALTAEGVYTATERTADGCDENYTITLTVKPRQDHNETYTMCQGDTYEWHGQTITTTGIYNATETNDYGCDENFTLAVTVKNRQDYNETYEICAGDTYTWHGQAITAAGTYTAYENNADGCSEQYTLVMTVKPRQDHFETDEICKGETYTWHGQALTASGVYTAQETTADGCVENYMITLTVKPRQDYNEVYSICDGETYNWHGQALTATGIYNAQETNAGGCVENYTLVLTVYPRQEHNETYEMCNGEVYNWHGQVYTTTGVYTAQEANANGCVENYTLILTVKDREDHIETETICNGETYTWHGQALTTAGVYNAVERNADGCAENYTLTLTVKPRADHSETVEICDGETYNWHGQAITETGIYNATETNAYGCDENYTLVLTVRARQDYSETYEMCDGESYAWHGSVITAAGTYIAQETNANGCTENYTLVVTVFARQDHIEAAEICDGETYTWHGQALTTGGVYTAVENNANGCAENYTITLTVKPRVDHNETAEICNGETYEWHGQTYTTTGIYYATETNAYGCDENYTLSLIVKQKDVHNETHTMCNGETYTWHGQTYTSAGTFYAQEVNAFGCVEDYTLVLTVKPTNVYNDTYTICEGESYTWHNQVYTEAGIYTATEVNTDACIDTYTLTLFVNPKKNNTITESICEGETYTVGTQSFTTTGVHNIVLTTAQGCDSIVTLDLTVHPKKTTILNETICEGGSFTVADQTYSTAGLYVVTIPSARGCDSTIMLNLSVTPTKYTTINETICEGETYTVGNETFTVAGSYTVVLTTAIGCDSVVNLNLKVNDKKYTVLDEAICEGEIFTLAGHEFSTIGQHVVTLNTIYGCDSVITLNLNVYPKKTTNFDVVTCEGNAITIGDKTFDQTGIYQVNLTTAQGCDSTVNLNLTVNPRVYTTIEETICQDETYTHDGVAYTSAGNYTLYYTSATGCDSIVTLIINVNEKKYTTLNETICEGDSYFVGDVEFSVEGKHIVSFIADNGCDSIVTLNLSINPHKTYIEYASVEEGDYFEFCGAPLTESGTYECENMGDDGCPYTMILYFEIIEKTEYDAVDNTHVLPLVIAPNPIRKGGITFVNKEWSEAEREGMKVIVTSTTGQIVKAFTPTIFPIEIDDLTVSGMYHVRIVTGTGENYIGKIIVK